MFPSSTKREFSHFHVVVVQRRQRNVSKSVMHVQSCCFVDLNLLLFCHSRCRRRRRCLSSLVASASSCAVLPGASRHPRLRLETELNLQWRIQGRGLGRARAPLLFLDQTEARRVDPSPPPSLGLDPALTCQAIASNSRIVYVIGHEVVTVWQQPL